jgi:hypothetical protein
MSNIKAIRIVADVPFNYLDDEPAGAGLSREDVAFLAGTLLTPGLGVSYSYSPVGYIRSAHGGQTAMYRLVIDGHEALNVVYLQRMVEILLKVPVAQVHVAEFRDVEEDTAWEDIVEPSKLSGGAETPTGPLPRRLRRMPPPR